MALLALALSLLGSSLASAQQIVNIAGDPVCDSCTIETEEVTVLVSPERVGLTPRDKIALASDGKVWVAPFAMPYALLRYLPDGTQDVWIEARGEGPREFNRIERVVVGPGDLLHVFGNGKVNRYSPAGEFLDTRRPVITPFRQLLSVVIVPDGSLLFNGAVMSPNADLHIFHLLDPAGELMRSFGPQTRGYEVDAQATRRRLAASDDGTFWAAPQNRYEIELWSHEGELQRRIVREVDWFEPWTGRFEPPFEEPPMPRVWDIEEDDAGNLWVLMYVAADDFSPLPRPTTSDLTAPGDAHTPSYDTIIEVLDPDAGQVIAWRRFPNVLVRGFLEGHHGFLHDMDEDGEQVFRILRMRRSR